MYAADRHRGLQWQEVFEFLYYENFEQNPEDSVYVGFYLKYDFNHWLATLPVKAGMMLWSPAGKAARIKKTGFGRYPVRCEDWEFDMPAGDKCLQIRPRVCECWELRVKCTHTPKPWMTICDAGSYFQTGFQRVLEDWPVTARVWSDDEQKKIEYGKNNLRQLGVIRKGSKLEKQVTEYNELENVILARIMRTIAQGLHELGIKLPRDRWYGPGPVAAEWLHQNGGIKHKTLSEWKHLEEWFKLCQYSFYGGWFEIFSHGIIPGKSYNYDINSAYPYATTKLPHLCEHCQMSAGKGRIESRNDYVLLYATVRSKNSRIGAMPYRDSHGSILRPNITKGWYWAHELDAANSAGLVESVEYHAYRAFHPCNNDRPFASIGDLYIDRKSVV